MILNLNSGIPKKYIDKGDSDNKDLINAEVQNRQSADNTLQGNINTEATTRKNADDALQALIDDLEENYNGLGSAAHIDTGTTSGKIPVIGSNGKLDTSIMPDLTISEFQGTVSTVAGLTTLVSQTGDWAIVNGESDVAKNGTYILTSTAYGTASNWKKMATPDLVWGIITGDITAQADLKNALDAKFDANKYFGPETKGTSGKQVFTGTGWATMPATWAEAPGGVEERAATPASVEFVRHYLQTDFNAAKIFSFVGDLVEVSGVSLPEGYTKAYGTKDIEGNAPGYLVRHDSLNMGVVVMATPEPGKEIEWAEAEAKLIQVSAQTGGVSQYYYVIAKSDISALKVQVVVLDGNMMAYPDVEYPFGEASSGV
jgi:hypothetical protein